MSGITTHVLDTARGVPAAGVPVLLEMQDGVNTWRPIGRGATDPNGRITSLMAEGESLQVGVYRLVFNTVQYFDALGVATFYPRVIVEFETSAGEAHYHVPLLISPFGYSTYRGS